MTYHIASVSWGKDSLAMLLMLIARKWPIDEVVFFDTGMEFDAVYDVRDQTLQLLRDYNIKYTELRPKDPMWWSMFARPVKKRGTDIVHKHGYGWCGGACRWGTTEKQRAIDRYAEKRDATVYIGIAADEQDRLDKTSKPYKKYPLASLGMTESDCLEYCRKCGYTWEQEGIPLYSILNRVSCWCCRNKNQKELKAIHDHLPDTWRRLCALEDVLGQMKTKPLKEIGNDTE